MQHGTYADCISSMAGADIGKIIPKRGEYLVLDKRCGTLVSNTIFRAPNPKVGKGILVSPTADGNLLIGPTSEAILDKEDVSTTAEGLEFIIESARTMVPDLPKNKTIATYTGLRAYHENGDFILDNPIPRFINAAGIESPGLTSAPAIALHIVEMLQSCGLELSPNHDFNPGRKRYIAPKGTYDKIVCRCEIVSEGEIIAAIHENPAATTVDAVKLRTRAGMGRCQGGFCLPRVTALLAQELGIAMEEVTKSGPLSNIVMKMKED